MNIFGLTHLWEDRRVATLIYPIHTHTHTLFWGAMSLAEVESMHGRLAVVQCISCSNDEMPLSHALVEPAGQMICHVTITLTHIHQECIRTGG